MQFDASIETLAVHIHALTREGCLDELARIERPRLDFTPEFLGAMTTDQLKHVLMAACLRARMHRPSSSRAA